MGRGVRSTRLLSGEPFRAHPPFRPSCCLRVWRAISEENPGRTTRDLRREMQHDAFGDAVKVPASLTPRATQFTAQPIGLTPTMDCGIFTGKIVHAICHSDFSPICTALAPLIHCFT
jgi:hypothetical protein